MWDFASEDVSRRVQVDIGQYASRGAEADVNSGRLAGALGLEPDTEKVQLDCTTHPLFFSFPLGMASQDIDVSASSLTSESNAPTNANAVDDVVEAVAKVSLQDEVAADVNDKTTGSPPRPLRVYTRYEVLHLSRSPLVGLPQGMPAFKDWFGCVSRVQIAFSALNNRL